ncbi:hypothetical protein [Nocardia sp. NPDC052316]|uniref:hypothetical protein n=1 Tax=Nocardia sp. NPDC052316 TaxID=3364329 RepID=UPI0037C9564A
MVVSTLAAVAGLTLAVAPNAAADETATFRLVYGATYFIGTIEFYNRSVLIAGNLRGLSTGCRRGWAFAENGSWLDYNSTSATCTGPVYREIPLKIDVPGGVAKVDVHLTEADGNTLADCTVLRGEEYCLPLE